MRRKHRTAIRAPQVEARKPIRFLRGSCKTIHANNKLRALNASPTMMPNTREVHNTGDD
jgi:hypothetical protein